ncbi:MAG: hypothetical protein JXB88_18980 [Spirochaetales bacterium]|nr:hypothetical protein [Spirochaetales bacterium]
MTVKPGIIGCGIATNQFHWPALEQLEDKFHITAVCNHTLEKAQLFAALAGKAYGTEIARFPCTCPHTHRGS